MRSVAFRGSVSTKGRPWDLKFCMYLAENNNLHSPEGLIPSLQAYIYRRYSWLRTTKSLRIKNLKNFVPKTLYDE